MTPKTFSLKKMQEALNAMDIHLKNTSMAEEEEKEKKTEIWLSEFLKTDKDEREKVLKKARAGVVLLGRLSCTILTSIIAWRKDEEITEIFRRFRECLEERIEPDRHSLVVLDGIFAVVEAGERALREQREANWGMELKGEDGKRALREQREANWEMVLKREDRERALREQREANWAMVLNGEAIGYISFDEDGEDDDEVVQEKGEADRTEEMLKIWSVLDSLSDQIIFMEDLVRLVMTQTVGAATVHCYLGHSERFLMSVDMVVSYRRHHLALLCGGDGSESTVTEEAMSKRTGEIWSQFQLYHQPFATRSD